MMAMRTIRFEKAQEDTGSDVTINKSVFIVDETGTLADCQKECRTLMGEFVATKRKIDFSTTHRSFNAMLNCHIMTAYI